MLGPILIAQQVMVLGGTVISHLAVLHQWPAALALACGLVLTTACGLLNGWLVSGLRLPPFIVTLGSFNAAWCWS